MTFTASLVIEKALELGFDRAGIVVAQPPPHRDAFDQWLDQGFHGSMEYLARHRELRGDPTLLHPGTTTVVAVAMSYRPPGDATREYPIARYAWGPDYHRVMRRQLKQLARFLRDEAGLTERPCRACVDTAPILERDFAQVAGLGWYGKNANIISPELGSYLFLGELLVPGELEPWASRMPDRCGQCRACLDHCPTGAIVAPRVIDSRRCISYLTIEFGGTIPEPLRGHIGSHLFGCDLCQSVCPWNRKARPSRGSSIDFGEQGGHPDPIRLLTLTRDEFALRFRGSALLRAGRDSLARNAAVVLGNRGDPRAIEPLAVALHQDPSDQVRLHAAWALGRFDDRRARTAIESALAREEEPAVLAEIRQALERG